MWTFCGIKSGNGPGAIFIRFCRRIRADWKEERVSIDLFDKLTDRQISKQDIWTTLTSPQSYIARYWYYNGNRVGLWHPPTRTFVA